MTSIDPADRRPLADTRHVDVHRRGQTRDHLLGLRRTRTLRLLAVVSDGHLHDLEPAQRLITTLHRAGCAVLWLHPANLSGHTFTHTAAIRIADRIAAIAAISDA
jgi:hypothetical protein